MVFFRHILETDPHPVEYLCERGEAVVSHPLEILLLVAIGHLLGAVAHCLKEIYSKFEFGILNGILWGNSRCRRTCR